jgi:hypothetical protein
MGEGRGEEEKRRGGRRKRKRRNERNGNKRAKGDPRARSNSQRNRKGQLLVAN